MTDKATQAQHGASNMEKPPEQWTTGDEPMTGAQRSYLKTLSEEARVPFDETLTKAQASRRIDELQQRTGRGARGSTHAADARRDAPTPKTAADRNAQSAASGQTEADAQGGNLSAYPTAECVGWARPDCPGRAVTRRFSERLRARAGAIVRARVRPPAFRVSRAWAAPRSRP